MWGLSFWYLVAFRHFRLRFSSSYQLSLLQYVQFDANRREKTRPKSSRDHNARHAPVKVSVRWATGKRLTNRLPKLSLMTLSPPF